MIGRFRAATEQALGSRRRARAEWRLREILGRRYVRHVEEDILAPGEFERLLDRIANREIDPYGAARSIMTRGAGRIDHVGVAVADPQPLVALFRDLFDLATGEPEDVGRHRVRFVETGGTTIELVEALEPDSPVAKFLAQRGAGLHHVCLVVEDIDAALAALVAKHVRLIDERPRPGAHGSRIAFLHPSSTHGLLIELKELAPDAAG